MLGCISCNKYLCHHSQKINEKPQVVMDYEAGRAIPNQVIINKLERAVGKKLFFILPPLSSAGKVQILNQLNAVLSKPSQTWLEYGFKTTEV